MSAHLTFASNSSKDQIFLALLAKSDGNIIVLIATIVYEMGVYDH